MSDTQVNGGKVETKEQPKKGEPVNDVVLAPLSKIKVQWKNNARSNYLEIEELAAQIKAEGLLTPLTVDSNYNLVAGYRRYKALSEHLYKDKPDTLVKCTVKTFEHDNQRFLVTIGENTGRQQLEDYDLAKYLDWLTDEEKGLGFKPSMVAKWTGLAQSEISRLVTTYNGLAPKVLKAWEQSASGELKDVNGKVTKLPTYRLRDWAKTATKEDKTPDAKAQSDLLEAFLDGDRPITKDEETAEGEEKSGGGSKGTVARGPTQAEIKEYVMKLDEKKKEGGGLDDKEQGKYSALRWVLGPAGCKSAKVDPTSRP